jgi:hypothetical protein
MLRRSRKPQPQPLGVFAIEDPHSRILDLR